jgi:hypothetical protein
VEKYKPSWVKRDEPARWEARIGPFMLLAERVDGYWKGAVAIFGPTIPPSVHAHMARACGAGPTGKFRLVEKAKAEAVERCAGLLAQLQADLKELTEEVRS